MENMDYKFCIYCGAKLPENGKFCIKCGKQFGSLQGLNDNVQVSHIVKRRHPIRNKKTVAVITVMLALVLIVIGGLAVVNHTRKNKGNDTSNKQNELSEESSDSKSDYNSHNIEASGNQSDDYHGSRININTLLANYGITRVFVYNYSIYEDLQWPANPDDLIMLEGCFGSYTFGNVVDNSFSEYPITYVFHGSKDEERDTILELKELCSKEKNYRIKKEIQSAISWLERDLNEEKLSTSYLHDYSDGRNDLYMDTEIKYDKYGRLVSYLKYHDSFSDRTGAEYEFCFSYDDDGNVASISYTNDYDVGLISEYRYKYSKDGIISNIEMNESEFTYNENGEISSIVFDDYSIRAYLFQYDENGYPTIVTNMEYNKESEDSRYDGAEYWRCKTDSEGNVYEIAYVDDDGNERDQRLFEYDGNGNLLRMGTVYSNDYAYVGKYDSNGNLTSWGIEGEDSRSFEKFSYDDDSRLIRYSYYDTDLEYEYYRNGHLKTLIQENGCRTTYDYDSYDNVSSVDLYNSDNRMLSSHEYNYSVDEKTDPLTKSTGFSEEDWSFIALKYYVRNRTDGYIPMYSDVSIDDPRAGMVTIHLYDDMGSHTTTVDWYNIDELTNTGTDLNGNEVDFNEVIDDSDYVYDSKLLDQQMGYIYYVNVDADDGGVNFRNGPSVEYDTLTEEMIPNGIRLGIMSVTRNNNGGKWGYTVWSGREGWIALSETSQREPFYGIWCFATHDYSNAKNVADNLSVLGFNGQVFTSNEWSNLNSEKWYVVTAGVFAEESDAEKIIESVKSAGYAQAYINASGDYIGSE